MGAELRLGEFVFEMSGVEEDEEALECNDGELIGDDREWGKGELNEDGDVAWEGDCDVGSVGAECEVLALIQRILSHVESDIEVLTPGGLVVTWSTKGNLFSLKRT